MRGFWWGVVVGAGAFYVLTHMMRVPKVGGGAA
jgi:hypothetical protein